MGAILEPGRSKSSRPWGALLQGACGASALRMAKASACAALHIDTCGRSEAQRVGHCGWPNSCLPHKRSSSCTPGHARRLAVVG